MNASLPDIHEFLSQKSLAIVGASRSGNKFGNTILKSLRQNGYRLFPIHPTAETIEGEKSYPEFQALPAKVGGVVVCVPPIQAEKVLHEAQAAGINRVWLQQGAESYAAIRFCELHGIKAVHGECILMFAEPVLSFHRFHRWVWRLFGRYPSVSGAGDQSGPGGS